MKPSFFTPSSCLREHLHISVSLFKLPRDLRSTISSAFNPHHMISIWGGFRGFLLLLICSSYKLEVYVMQIEEKQSQSKTLLPPTHPPKCSIGAFSHCTLSETSNLRALKLH